MQAGDVDADDAAHGHRIVWHPFESDLGVAVDAERVLRAVVDAARVRKARFVHQARAHHLRPAGNRAVRLQVVPAPGRRRRAVEDPAEPAGHEPEAIAVDVTDEERVAVRQVSVDTSQVAVRFILHIRLVDEVVATRRVGAGHQRDDFRRHRVEPVRRNRVVGEVQSRERIPDRRGRTHRSVRPMSAPGRYAARPARRVCPRSPRRRTACCV